MKQLKERVVAIDYFRGICILVILLSHSASFNLPYGYLSGLGRLWTGAAAFFFLLSGLTLGVVRGKTVVSDFKAVLHKSWTRARDLYLLYLITALGTILIIPFITSQAMFGLTGSAPTASGFSLLVQVATFHYAPGLANFLIYYSVYMLLAPLALYVLYRYRKAWPVLLLPSVALYVLNTSYPFHLLSAGIYGTFATWQLYFVLGMILARFRVAIISWYYGLRQWIVKATYRLVTLSAGVALVLSAALGFNLLPHLTSLTAQGWLPAKLLDVYVRLIDHKPTLDLLLMNGRTGILRPLAAVLCLAAGYLLYQKHKSAILRYSGKFVTAMGRDALWIFVAQSLLIPLMSLLPLRHNLITSTAMTAALIGSMWLITQRQRLLAWVRGYAGELQAAFYQAKSTAMYRQQDSS